MNDRPTSWYDSLSESCFLTVATAKYLGTQCVQYPNEPRRYSVCCSVSPADSIE